MLWVTLATHCVGLTRDECTAAGTDCSVEGALCGPSETAIEACTSKESETECLVAECRWEGSFCLPLEVQNCAAYSNAGCTECSNVNEKVTINDMNYCINCKDMHTDAYSTNCKNYGLTLANGTTVPYVERAIADCLFAFSSTTSNTLTCLQCEKLKYWSGTACKNKTGNYPDCEYFSSPIGCKTNGCTEGLEVYSNACRPKKENCLAYEGTGCKTCEEGYKVISGNCISNCTIGRPCTACFANGSCRACEAGYSLIDGECYEPCVGQENCLLCNPKDLCERCEPGYELAGNACLKVCALNQVRMGGGCTDCGPNALSCVLEGDSALQITRCYDGYYSAGAVCAKCTYGCSKCTAAGNCVLGYLDADYTGAVENNIVTGIQRCPSRCSGCELAGGSPRCLACAPGYTHLTVHPSTSETQDDCYQECNASYGSYYFHSDWRCVKCPAAIVGCNQCKDAKECAPEGCKSGYVGSNGMCYKAALAESRYTSLSVGIRRNAGYITICAVAALVALMCVIVGVYVCRNRSAIK